MFGCAVTAPGLGYVGGWDWNISDNTERWAGYEPDRIYALRQDVFLLSIENRTNGIALVPGIQSDVPRGTLRGSTTILSYQADPRPWPWIGGVVESGTRMRATRLRSKGNLRAPSMTRVYVKAQIMDGPHRTKVVDLEPLSLYETDSESGQTILLGPNEDFLKRSD